MAQEQLRTFVQQLRRVVHPDGGSDLSDAQLLERFVSRRDEAAFEVLVYRHGGLMLNVCGRLLRRAEDREDAFQATFLILSRRAGAIAKRASLGSWLYKVAYRVALRVRSREVRHATQPENDLDRFAVQSATNEVGTDVRALLDEEINRLPDKYRVALLLCYLQGKTTAEEAVGLLVELAQGRTSAAMVRTTVQTAVSFISGHVSAGAFPKPAIALAEGVFRSMMLTKLKMTLAGLVVLGVLGLGAGLGTKRVVAEKVEAEEKSALVRGSDGIRLPANLLTKLGIQSTEVKSRGRAFPRVLELPGSLAIDPERLTRVRCRFAPAEVIEIGQIEEKGEKRALRAGDKVRKGQRLAVLLSRLDVGAKKSELFDALWQLRLDQDILARAEKARSAIPEVVVQNVQCNVQVDRTAVNRARNMLLACGISEEEIEAIRKEAEEKPKGKEKLESEKELEARLQRWSRVELKAPSDGTVVECSISLHQMNEDRTRNLFQIAQLEQLMFWHKFPRLTYL